MATSTTQEFSENQKRIRLEAQIKLNDSFDGKSISSLNALSPNIIPHLSDFFMLAYDLRANLVEEYRRIYFDYSFVLFPAHKALECFLSSILELIFDFKVSKEKPVGVYLSYTDEDKEKILDKILKQPWGKNVSKAKWKDRWNAWAQQWQQNRNPLTHPEQERILSLNKAEQIAGGILREMEISLKLFMPEYIDPLMDYIRKREERKSAEKAMLEEGKGS